MKDRDRVALRRFSYPRANIAMRNFQPLPKLANSVARCTRALLVFAAFAASASSHATGTSEAEIPCSKIDTGYVLDDSERGSFGSTSTVKACVDVLRAQFDGLRRLRIFVDGKRVLSNDAIAMGPDDGGMLGDPFQALEISHGSLVVRNDGGGGSLRWSETWRLTIRDGRWIVAGWDKDAWDFHAAADGGGEFHTSVNALTGDVNDSYAPPGEDATAKRAVRRVCKLPTEWSSPSIAQIAAIRDRSWHCDAKLGKPL
jgi:hypothetical protein